MCGPDRMAPARARRVLILFFVVNSRIIALRESLRVSSHFPCSNRLILHVYSNRIDCVPSRPLTTSASGPPERASPAAVDEHVYRRIGIEADRCISRRDRMEGALTSLSPVKNLLQALFTLATFAGRTLKVCCARRALLLTEWLSMVSMKADSICVARAH